MVDMEFWGAGIVLVPVSQIDMGNKLHNVIKPLLRCEVFFYIICFGTNDGVSHDFFTAGEFHKVCHSLVVVDGKVVGFFQCADEI